MTSSEMSKVLVAMTGCFDSYYHAEMYGWLAKSFPEHREQIAAFVEKHVAYDSVEGRLGLAHFEKHCGDPPTEEELPA